MIKPEPDSQRLTRLETRHEDVLRRLVVLEAKAVTADGRGIETVPGATQFVRDVAEDMLRDRLSLNETQIKELKAMQTRLMWLVFIGLAGQVLRMIGPSGADLIGKLG